MTRVKKLKITNWDSGGGVVGGVDDFGKDKVGHARLGGEDDGLLLEELDDVPS